MSPFNRARRLQRSGLGHGVARWLLASALALGCAGKRPLATLEQRMGPVERDSARELQIWKPAEVGATFLLGDGVQTLEAASAELALDDGTRLSLEPSTLIRFSDHPGPERVLAFDVELGAVALQADGDGTSVQTRVGLARIEPGSRVVLSRDGAELRFSVRVGQAVFADSEPLGAGQDVSIAADGVPRPVVAASEKAEPASSEKPEPGAVTASVKGNGASVRRGEGDWSPLPEGSSPLEPGTELQLGGRSSVELRRGAARARLESKGRYVVAPRPDVLVKASEGSLSAGGSDAVRIDVPGGTIVVAADGRVRLKVDQKGTQLDVESKDALIEAGDKSERARAGERATLAPNGVVTFEGRGLDYADLEIDAGESLVVHDPTPATAIRFRFGVCKERGKLQLAVAGRRQNAFGAESVALEVPVGSSRYSLRCDGSDAVVKEGTVRVIADRGTRRMASHPPATTLQADGRKYTVLYQNRLPALTLVWPEAPGANDLRLIHEHETRRETLALDQPSRPFPSGALEEGEHTFYFEGGGKLSRITRVDIAFDNAAPTATLSTPSVVDAKPGDAVALSGVALPGWSVVLDGQRVATDSQGRFAMNANMPSDPRALAVRLSHPARGTHVYLRRGRVE